MADFNAAPMVHVIDLCLRDTDAKVRRAVLMGLVKRRSLHLQETTLRLVQGLVADTDDGVRITAEDVLVKDYVAKGGQMPDSSAAIGGLLKKGAPLGDITTKVGGTLLVPISPASGKFATSAPASPSGCQVEILDVL